MLSLPAAYADVLKKLVPEISVCFTVRNGKATMDAELRLHRTIPLEPAQLDLTDTDKIKNLANAMARETAKTIRTALEAKIAEIDKNQRGNLGD